MTEEEKPKRVLPDVSDLQLCIVESNKEILEFVELFINLHIGKFKKITVVASGTEAIELYLKTPFDIILIDAMKPEMNCLQLSEELSKIATTQLGIVAFEGQRCENNYASKFYALSSPNIIPYMIYRQGVIIPELDESMTEVIRYLQFRRRVSAGNI